MKPKKRKAKLLAMKWMHTGEGLEITKDTKVFSQECPNCCLDHKVTVEWKGDSVVLTRENFPNERENPK